jgi:hypothetical protein
MGQRHPPAEPRTTTTRALQAGANTVRQARKQQGVREGGSGIFPSDRRHGCHVDMAAPVFGVWGDSGSCRISEGVRVGSDRPGIWELQLQPGRLGEGCDQRRDICPVLSTPAWVVISQPRRARKVNGDTNQLTELAPPPIIICVCHPVIAGPLDTVGRERPGDAVLSFPTLPDSGLRGLQKPAAPSSRLSQMRP